MARPDNIGITGAEFEDLFDEDTMILFRDIGAVFEPEEEIEILSDTEVIDFEIQTAPRALFDRILGVLEPGFVYTALSPFEKIGSLTVEEGAINEKGVAEWLARINNDIYEEEPEEPQPLKVRVDIINANPIQEGMPESLAENSNGDCVVQCIYKRWPSVQGKLEEWRRPLSLEEIHQLCHFLGEKPIRNKPTGVRFLDRTGNVWYEYNTLDRSDKMRNVRQIFEITIDHKHARYQTPQEIRQRPTKIEIVPEKDLVDLIERSVVTKVSTYSTNEGNCFGSAVREDDPNTVVVSERKLNLLKEEYRHLLPRGDLPEGAMPKEKFAQLLEKPFYANFATVSSIFWSVWRSNQPELRPLTSEPMKSLILGSMVEPKVYESKRVKGGEQAFDLVHAYSSWDNDYPDSVARFDHYALPQAPQLIVDAMPHEFDTVLNSTGFARVQNVKAISWQLKLFPYVEDGQVYPTVWLAYLHRRKMAEFTIDAWMPCGKFTVGLRGPRRIFRHLVGKLVQKSRVEDNLFVSREEEKDRLVVGCVGRIQRISKMKAGERDGWLITTSSKVEIAYPHVRSFILAYSHIKVFDLLRNVQKKDLLKVKTDSVCVVKGSASDQKIWSWLDRMNLFRSNGTIGANQDAGAWKNEAVKRTIPKKPQRYAVPDHAIETPSRIHDGRTCAELTFTQTQPTNQGDEVILKGTEIGGSKIESAPFVIMADGGAGHGKSHWTASALKAADSVLIVSLGRRQGLESFEKLSEETQKRTQCTSLRALTEGFKRDWFNSLWNKVENRPSAIWVEETSLLCKKTVEQIMEIATSLGTSLVVFSGDFAQLDPICSCCNQKTDVNGKRLPKSDIRVYAPVDIRSKDNQTRELKATLRRMRLSGFGEEGSLSRAKKLINPEQFIDIDEAVQLAIGLGGTIVCGTRAQCKEVNEKAAKELCKREEVESLKDLNYPLPSRCSKIHNEGDERIGQGTFRMMTAADWTVNGVSHWELGFGATCHTVQGATLNGPVIVYPSGHFLPGGWTYTAFSRHESSDQLYVIGVIGYAGADEVEEAAAEAPARQIVYIGCAEDEDDGLDAFLM